MYIALIDSSPHIREIIEYLSNRDLTPLLFCFKKIEGLPCEQIECSSIRVNPINENYRIIYKALNESRNELCMDCSCVIYSPSLDNFPQSITTLGPVMNMHLAKIETFKDSRLFLGDGEKLLSVLLEKDLSNCLDLKVAIPFSKKELNQSKLAILEAKAKEIFDKRIQKFEQERAEWDLLENYEKAKVKSPLEPVTPLEFLEDQKPYSIESMEDNDDSFLVLESDLNSKVKSYDLASVVSLYENPIDRSLFEGLNLELDQNVFKGRELFYYVSPYQVCDKQMDTIFKEFSKIFIRNC